MVYGGVTVHGGQAVRGDVQPRRPARPQADVRGLHRGEVGLTTEAQRHREDRGS